MQQFVPEVEIPEGLRDAMLERQEKSKVDCVAEAEERLGEPEEAQEG